MKILMKMLWVIIITGVAFISYEYLAPNPATDLDQIDSTPQTSQTDLQEEVEKQVESNKTVSSLIAEGDQQYNNGYYDKALKSYKNALIKDPNSAQSIYKIGLTYLSDNKPVEARQYFEQLKEVSSNIQVDILIGRTYINNREIEEASEHFNSLDQTNKEIAYYTTILKILYKDHEEAKTALLALTEKLNTESELDQELKKKVTIFLEAYQSISLNRESKDQHEEALLAKAFIDVEEFAASIPLLFDIIDLQNNYRDAWIMLGYSYLQTGKTADALDALKQAQTLDSEKPETLFFLGLTYAVQEDYDQSITYLENAAVAGFQPEDLINQKLADLYLIKKDYNKALESYVKTIENGVADINIFTKAVWICIEKIEKPHRAIQVAKYALKQFPEEANSFSLLGWGYVAAEEYDQAKDNLITALEMDPNLDSAYLNLGWMYEKQDLEHIAKEYYKKAYSLGTGNSISNLAAIRFNNILKADITSPYSP
jgi:tetratricopeptide (TPR) repeat protein